MLYLETVEPGTLSLLKRLQQLPQLSEFYLVGGTALALKFGHRKSVDLDLFTTQELKIEEITSSLQREFGNQFVYEHSNIKWAIFCQIQNVKVDIVRYKDPQIYEPEEIEGIRMYSNEDIAAMKINAILGRGAKKDFFDIDQLLKHYSLSEIIKFHKKKFPSQMLLISIPNALSYFEDAEKSEDPIALNGQNWNDVKKSIQNKIREYFING